MREQILTMLKNTENYVSGQELCESFCVSRTAVWKAIHSLQKEGYEIEAVRNRGYRLVSSPDILLSEEIGSLLQTDYWGREIHYDKITDSTNNEIRRAAEKGASEGLLAIAEEQTAGKGRRGRTWVSEPEANIYMSFLLRPSVLPEKASMITLVAAMACCRGIEAATGLQTEIKWPNDLVIQGRKVVGILTEMSTEMTSIQYVVVGIGINVNQKAFPKDLTATATSLYLESGETYRRGQIVAQIGKYFEQYYAAFQRDGDLRSLVSEYNDHLVNCGREVLLLEGEQCQKRVAKGINDAGELLVEDDTGAVSSVRFGEVSVRGVYGYV